MPKHDSKLSIVGVAGSLRNGSCSQLALQRSMSLLSELGCRTNIVELQKLDLPFCNSDSSQQWLSHPGVLELRSAFLQAEGIVLVTPEYHGSVSGVLKNALDLLEREHLQGKVAGLISVLGGAAGTGALHDLSRIMRSCHAWVIPEQIAIGWAHKVFVNGRIADGDIERRLERFTQTLAQSVICLCRPEWSLAQPVIQVCDRNNEQLTRSYTDEEVIPA